MYTSTAAGSIGMFIVVLVVTIGLFLLLRGVVIWYFKINAIIDLLTKQLNNQRLILKHLTGEPGEPEKK
ncbi:MAG: hypothetical protein ACOYNC_07190 [Bacteroidales bacterium]